MAKQRMIDTKFWTDYYIQELNPNTKMFYLYLMTNPSTNIAGCYEISLKTMQFDTGLTIDTIKRCIDTLSIGHKICYHNGWLLIRNFVKHQSTSSIKVQRGIEIEKAKIPDTIAKKLYGIDTLSNPIIYSNSNSNSNSNTNPNILSDFPPSLTAVTNYCKERNNSVKPQSFIDHYTTNGWIRGKTKIKDWKACIRTWESKDKDTSVKYKSTLLGTQK